MGNGTAVIPGSTILYTTDPGFSGTDTINYIITDSDLTDTAVVTINVTPTQEDFFIFLPMVIKP